MFQPTGRDEANEIMSQESKEQLLRVMKSTPGFARFIIYVNAVSEGGRKLDKLLNEADLSNQVLKAVFRRVALDLFNLNFEILFEKIDNPHVVAVLAEKLSLDEAYIPSAEQAYQEGELCDPKSEQDQRFLTFRVLSDLFTQNFSQDLVRKLIIEREDEAEFIRSTREKAEELIEDKFQISLSQYIFLSYILMMSTQDPQGVQALLGELKEIYKADKSFFSSEHKAIFKDIAQL